MLPLQKMGKVNVKPTVALLSGLDHLFGVVPWRETTPGSAHHHTQTIYMRMPSTITRDGVFNSLEAVDWPIMAEPVLYDLVHDVCRVVKGEPARVMLVKMLPESRIDPHVDQGDYADATNRYHVPLTSNPEVVYLVGDHEGHMEIGEVWHFGKHLPHAVVNLGNTERVNLIVDTYKH